jgi:acyl dehydratase
MIQVHFEDVGVGIQIPSWVNEIDLLKLIRYAAVCWNFYLLHLEKEFAQRKGFKDVNIPAPYYGSFLASMMTKWIGDPASLKKLSYTVKVMGFPGDTLIGKGTVIKKYRDGGKNLVDCDIWVENHEGVKVALGSATVALPSKN